MDDQRWQCEPQSSTTQTCNACRQLWTCWVLAGAVLLISVPTAWMVGADLHDHLERDDLVVLLVFIFPLVGLALLVRDARVTRAWRHYGHSIWHMDPCPGAVGG